MRKRRRNRPYERRRPSPVRCTHRVRGVPCGYRRTLVKPLGEYVRPPKCPKCGTTFVYVDVHRVRKEWQNKKRRCCCYGYGFPHARGRGYCIHNPKLTAEDLRLREEGGPRRAPDDPPF